MNLIGLRWRMKRCCFPPKCSSRCGRLIYKVSFWIPCSMGRGYYYGNRYSSYSSYKPYWRSRYSYKPASKPKPADYLDLYLKQFQYEIKSIHVYQSEPLTSL
jgi:hypothetical protein